MKGGRHRVGGQRAAASHTGALATDDRGVRRRLPPGRASTRAATIEEAYEAAATFATQPLPTGPRVVRGHDRRRLGRGHRRRHRRAPASSCSPLPDDLPRRALDQRAAAPLEPQQPDRPGRRRDPRHDPQGAARWWRRTPTSTPWCSSAWASSGTRAAWSGRARSTPTTASSGSSPTTSARTPASPTGAAELADATGKPILIATELAVSRPRQPRPCRGPRDAGGSATPSPTGPCTALCATSGATPAGASAAVAWTVGPAMRRDRPAARSLARCSPLARAWRWPPGGRRACGGPRTSPTGRRRRGVARSPRCCRPAGSPGCSPRRSPTAGSSTRSRRCSARQPGAACLMVRAGGRSDLRPQRRPPLGHRRSTREAR